MPVGGFVSSGELRSRVTILRPTGTTSSTGGVTEGSAETVVSNAPAAIASSPANEQVRAGALNALVTHVVRMRYVSGLKPYMTLTFEGREFQILSIVDVDERHVEHQLLCAEVQ